MSSHLQKNRQIIFILALLMLLPGLALAGSISGMILDTYENLIEEQIRVAYSTDMMDWTEQVFDNGEYLFADLAGGSYALRACGHAEDTWLVTGYYPDVWNEEEAERVNVPADEDVNNVDIILHYGGRISGSVTPGEGGEFEDYIVVAALYVAEENGFWWEEFLHFPLFNPSDYTSEPIPPGDYKIVFRTMAPDMHVDTYYGGTWDQWEAELFTIQPREITTDIDVEMPVGGGVTGTITGDGAPLGYSFVIAFVMGASPISFMTPFTYGMADVGGVYNLYGLPEGECYVQFMPSDEQYAMEWYDGVYNIVDATPVPIASGEFTQDIDADVERGAQLHGTIRTPEGSVPAEYSVGIQAVGQYGHDDQNIDIMWDEEGNWATQRCAAPGVLALRIDCIWGSDWASTFLNGVLHAWDADWMYLGPGADAGPFDIQLEYGGIVEGVVTDPDDNPAMDVWVELYHENQAIDDMLTDEEGRYRFEGVPAGDYKLSARINLADEYEEENGRLINEDRLWPFVCNGGAVQLSEAETFAVLVENTTTINMQFVEGGILHAILTDPDGNVPYIWEDNAGIVAFAIREDGLPMWEAVSYPDDMFPSDDEGVYIILPPATYTVAGIPAYTSMAGDFEADPLRRTFLGGGFSFDGAETFAINAGETTEIEFSLTSEGHRISGMGATNRGVPMNRYFMMAFLVDTDEFIVTAFINFFNIMGDGSFVLSGIPDGQYHLAAKCEEEAFAVSTWYPDVAAPNLDYPGGMPEGSEAIEVAGEDVEGIEIEVQTAGSFASVPGDMRRGYPVVKGYHLHNAYPNPFNNKACIGFTLPVQSEVSLKLFDLIGREVTNIVSSRFSAGTHHVILNANELAGGVYFIRMKAGDWKATRKVTLVK